MKPKVVTVEQNGSVDLTVADGGNVAMPEATIDAAGTLVTAGIAGALAVFPGTLPDGTVVGVLAILDDDPFTAEQSAGCHPVAIMLVGEGGRMLTHRLGIALPGAVTNEEADEARAAGKTTDGVLVQPDMSVLMAVAGQIAMHVNKQRTALLRHDGTPNA